MTNFTNPPEQPLPWLHQWLEEARSLDLPNPNAMTLATADAASRPSARTVLLKAIDERGATFFTNYHSRKGRELDANPRAALLFHWDKLDRQIRIEGPVSRVSEEESDEYFATRSRGSQIGAWASAQSEPITSRAALMAKAAKLTAQYLGRSVPRPPHWGGFRVGLEQIEFWQGREFRVHDRIVYTRIEGGWRVMRLSP